MYSGKYNQCSHWLGFPIRKSPDHRLLASTRGLSQLTTSFIACLRQGIHTHALSSLTIKSTSNTKCSDVIILALGFRFHRQPRRSGTCESDGSCITCVVMPVEYSIVKDQTSSSTLSRRFEDAENRFPIIVG